MFVSLLYSPLRAVRVILAINAHTHTHLCIRITRDRSSHVFACGLKCVCAHACLQALSPNCSSPMHTPGSGTQKNLTSGICKLSHTLEALSKTRQPAKEPHEWDLPIESHTRGPWMARRKKTRTSILKFKPGWPEEEKHVDSFLMRVLFLILIARSLPQTESRAASTLRYQEAGCLRLIAPKHQPSAYRRFHHTKAVGLPADRANPFHHILFTEGPHYRRRETRADGTPDQVVHVVVLR